MNEQEIIDSMFECKKLKARITPQTCINNQTKATNGLQFKKTYSDHNPCENCEEGIKRLPGAKKEVESKVCAVFKINPALCYGNPDGVFYRKVNDHAVNWDRKRFCNELCRNAAYNLKTRKRTVDYAKYEYCHVVKCPLLVKKKCTAKNSRDCIFTAKEFHEYLISMEYKINRKKTKEEKQNEKSKI